MLRAIPRPRLEFLEMMEAVERAAKDQERPFLADQLDRGGNRARQSRFPERVQVRRQRVCRHAPLSPLSNLYQSTRRFQKTVASMKLNSLFSCKSQL